MTDQDPEQIITGDPAQGREPEPQATGHRTCAQFVPADLPVGTVRHCGNRVHRIHQFSCTTVPDTRKTPPSDPTGQPEATHPPGQPAGNRRHTSPQAHTSSPTAWRPQATAGHTRPKTTRQEGGVQERSKQQEAAASSGAHGPRRKHSTDKYTKAKPPHRLATNRRVRGVKHRGQVRAIRSSNSVRAIVGKTGEGAPSCQS